MTKVEPDYEPLIAAAADARTRAYAPYSGFRMGAALLTTDDRIISGSLVENVSLGLAMCAERVALFGAVAAATKPVALALVSPPTDGRITFPCGACLQVGLELGGPELVVIVASTDGEREQALLADLLPRGPQKD